MKLVNGRSLFGLFLLVCVSVWAAPVQAAHCSLSGVAGRYGFTLNGVVILPTGPVPIAAIGKAVLDAGGSVSGTEARTVGGGYADETFTGTYTVNADCTGTTTLQFFESGNLVRTSILSIVFDNNEREDLPSEAREIHQRLVSDSAYWARRIPSDTNTRIAEFARTAPQRIPLTTVQRTRNVLALLEQSE